MARMFVALAVVAASASPAAAQPAPAKPKYAIERFTLANGLEVAVHPYETAPVVTVQMWYRAGSKDEPRDRRGMAHLFEYAMGKGSTHLRPDAHGQMVTNLGGHVGATAEEDATHLSSTLPAEHVDFAIRLEAERMRNLMFRPEMLDEAKTAAKDRLRRDDSLLTRGYQRMVELAYTKHSYGWSANGVPKDIDATKLDELKKFYESYYQPNNALLVVVGKVTVDQVKASAEKWFGPIPKAAAPPRPSQAAVEPPQTQKRRQVADALGPVGITLVGFHIPASKDPDVYALQLGSIILGIGDSSRLKQRLLRSEDGKKPPMAIESITEAVIREEPSMLVTLGAYTAPALADPVEAAILDEIGKLATKGPTNDELARAKTHARAAFSFTSESSQKFAQAIGRSWILVGDPTAFVRDLDEIEKVSAADVQRVVKKYLSTENMSVVVIPPRGK
jgi:zinc protease